MHFQAPDAVLLNQEMEVFINWFNTKQNLDPVLKAGIAHLWFITIHPFEDGNGIDYVVKIPTCKSLVIKQLPHSVRTQEKQMNW